MKHLIAMLITLVALACVVLLLAVQAGLTGHIPAGSPTAIPSPTYARPLYP